MNSPKIIAYLKPSCGWSEGVRAIMRKYNLAACRACKWRIRMIVQKVRRFRVQLEHFDHCSPLNGKFLL